MFWRAAFPNIPHETPSALYCQPTITVSHTQSNYWEDLLNSDVSCRASSSTNRQIYQYFVSYRQDVRRQVSDGLRVRRGAELGMLEERTEDLPLPKRLYMEHDEQNLPQDQGISLR